MRKMKLKIILKMRKRNALRTIMMLIKMMMSMNT